MRLFLILFVLPAFILAQPAGSNYYEFTPSPAYASLSKYADYEEVGFLFPNSKGKLEKLFFALTGDVARKDTIRVIGDPSDGSYAPSMWVNGILNYNLHAQYVIDYKPGQTWFELDLTELNLDIGGIDRIGISHLIKEGGPYFLADTNKNSKPNTAWLVQTFKPNTNFYNLRGIPSPVSTDFLLAATIKWGYGSSQGAPPSPTLVDVTEKAGLLGIEGELLKSAMGAVYDWNNDGYDDIYLASNYFKNNGDGTFSNVSEEFEKVVSGNKIFGDIDNDGYTDIFVARGGGNDVLYYGSADGYIENTDPVFKINTDPTTTPLFLDFNNDGQLDIFIARGRATVNGQEVYYQDQLFLNKGNRTFEDVTESSGIAAGEPAPFYDCWGASVTDYNNDGLTDIFVATYRLAPDLLYKNNGDGTFSQVSAETGVIGNETLVKDYYGHGMGSDWGDMNNDGKLDLVVGNLGHPDERGAYSNPSLLFFNGDDNKFVETHQELGLKFFEMNSGPTFVDLDNDGHLDIWSCQYSYDSFDKASTKKYSRVYMNQGDELNFLLKDMTWEFGGIIHGAWTALRLDYDLDGDMDLLVCSDKENVKLFENKLKKVGNFLNLRIDKENTSKGYSARITNNDKVLFRSNQGIVSTGRISQSTNMLHFGLGDQEAPLVLEIEHNDGESLLLEGLMPNTNYWMNRQGKFVLPIRPELISPLNEKVVKMSDSLKWKPMWNVEEIELIVNEKNGGEIFRDTITYTTNYRIRNIDSLDISKTYNWQIIGKRKNDETVISENGSFKFDFKSSVDNILTTIKTNIYPNPAKETLNLTIESESNKLYSMEIVDLRGRRVLDLGSIIIGGKLDLNYDIAALENGTYNIVISDSNNRTQILKLIVAK